jgi:hypothetical protein
MASGMHVGELRLVSQHARVQGLAVLDAVGHQGNQNRAGVRHSVIVIVQLSAVGRRGLHILSPSSPFPLPFLRPNPLNSNHLSIHSSSPSQPSRFSRHGSQDRYCLRMCLYSHLPRIDIDAYNLTDQCLRMDADLPRVVLDVRPHPETR